MVYRTKPKTVSKEMIGKGDNFWGSSRKADAKEYSLSECIVIIIVWK